MGDYDNSTKGAVSNRISPTGMARPLLQPAKLPSALIDNSDKQGRAEVLGTSFLDHTYSEDDLIHARTPSKILVTATDARNSQSHGKCRTEVTAADEMDMHLIVKNLDTGEVVQLGNDSSGYNVRPCQRSKGGAWRFW